MLLLARRPGDAVLLDGGIRITVVAVEGKTVRLGIEAPAAITILRAEIAAALASGNADAVASRDAAARLGLLLTRPEGPVPVPPSPEAAPRADTDE